MGNENEKAEFNAAIAYLNRINSLFALCTEASMELNMQEWYHTLKCIYRELSDEMDKEQRVSYGKRFEKIRPLTERQSDGIYRSLYDGLEDIEIELRLLYKKTGMKMKYQEDAKFALKS